MAKSEEGRFERQDLGCKFNFLSLVTSAKQVVACEALQEPFGALLIRCSDISQDVA